VAQLLISLPFPASNQFPASMQPTWQPPSIAAALDHRLVWWRMEGSSSCGGSSEITTHVATGFNSSSNADTDDVTSQQQQQQQRLLRCGDVGTRMCSDPQHGHTAFIDAFVKLPAAGGISLG
jgi:hypothetical protein